MRPCFKISKAKMAGDMTHMVEVFLASMKHCFQITALLKSKTSEWIIEIKESINYFDSFMELKSSGIEIQGPISNGYILLQTSLH
jgi:hypothetical protein